MGENEYILDTSKLKFDGDFNQQVDAIMQYVRLTKQEVQNLQNLLDDLQHAFSEVWQGCLVYGFGSIVTGLGIKTSDIDCYVKLPSWLSPPEECFVLKARNVLRRRYWIFQQLLAITTAKVPIVKFYHVPTRRCCDVNFTSPGGVQNSKLIAYFLSLDQRALYLAILIKYWSKVHKLTGVNLMPNYCLTMLVIFYLQQKDILPSVIQLQENTKEYYINSWNTAFNGLTHESNDNSSLYELLGGFFKYYCTFKFTNFIISPFIGKPVEKKLFLKPETLPPGFHLYKKYIEEDTQFTPLRLDSFMCVQDPFEHNRNSAIAVYPKLAQTILTFFRMGSDYFDSFNEENYLKNLLAKVDQPQKPAKKKRKNNKGVNKQYRQHLIHNPRHLNKIGTRVIKDIRHKK